jgi:hypothetical protein
LNRITVIAAATTGIAALLLHGGGTVHRQFFVPNEVEIDTPARINHESIAAQRFRDAKLIIIDVFFYTNFIMITLILGSKYDGQ